VNETVAVIVGSLRAASFSRRIAKALVERAPASLDCRFVEIGDLDLYNEDAEANAPAPWTRFRGEIGACQAALFVTPEYNRSIPGVLKNAIDVGSRPYSQSVWKGLPAAVVSVAPGKLAAFGANHALRQSFVFLDMPVMQQPEAYIGGVGDLVDEAGHIRSEDTSKFLKSFMEAFAAWIAKVRAAERGS
jgi:NAD(P)H-dependent FMN reductase